MIPRLKPYYNYNEVLAALRFYNKNSVTKFEQNFANLFHSKHAQSFSYGRSALYSLFKALNFENAEIILPAYTCVVVAHAITISGNIPRFVDISLNDYNMDLDKTAKKINKNTKAIIATHLFGYPLNLDKLNEIVNAAEKKFGSKIWIIHDCAHSFGAKWKNQLVCNQGDAAIFGLNISKIISSIFGGMVISNNDELFFKLKNLIAVSYQKPANTKSLKRLLYLLAVRIAFNKTIYGFINFLEEETNVLNSFTDYYKEDIVDFPADFLDSMLEIESRVGIEQLKKYPEIIEMRKANADYYFQNLKGIKELILPPEIDGATYSHFVPRIPNRSELLSKMRKKGIQPGWLIEYSIPEMAAYKKWKDEDFPNSFHCSKYTINLPNWPGMKKHDLEYITSKLNSYFS